VQFLFTVAYRIRTKIAASHPRPRSNAACREHLAHDCVYYWQLQLLGSGVFAMSECETGNPVLSSVVTALQAHL
jgi:hypothetical protein